MNTDKSPILEVKDLSVDFWVDGVWYRAVEALSYSIAPGQTLAIVGESGSGKSSAAMALMGLLPSNARISGTVKLQGTNVLELTEKQLQAARGRNVAYIFQEPMTALNPVYTVGFQIVETLRRHFDMSPKNARTRAIELLDMVELPNPEQVFDKYPHQLSGGQRQRAMIAQAISCDPELLIADEPTTALDVTVQAEILDLLRNLRNRLNSGILLITHDMGVVADLADNILVMKEGRSVEAGSASEVFSSPKAEYTQELLKAVPHLGRDESRLAPSNSKTTEPILRLSNVSVVYPKRGKAPAFKAVSGVSLDIHAGEIVGLVGESGSGKTTVGRAAVGLLPVSDGEIAILGKDISRLNVKDLRQMRRHAGIVFQDPGSSLNPRMPIGQSIGEPILLSQGVKGKELDHQVEELLDKVELPRSYRNRYPHELSGGQRQRVGIARALALSPDLLIADEPTSALDVSVQSRFLALLMQLQGDLRFACLFISHDLAVVDILAHRIAVMKSGEIVEIGSRDQILRNPTNEYTKRLLAAVPVPDPEQQQIRRETRLKTLKGKLPS
jgi:peptide/nickel transport system ATP-binding protein